MTHPDRDELFALLAELAHRYPHWRIGQLVANVAGWADAEVWDVEDAERVSAVRGQLNAEGVFSDVSASPHHGPLPPQPQPTGS